MITNVQPAPTTKDISLLYQLYKAHQLTWVTEYQRESVWPSAARAYLIDTIMEGKPLPLFFFRRYHDLQEGVNKYEVVDGQQRLRAIFDFLADKFRLSQSPTNRSYFNKRFSKLSQDNRNRILVYNVPVVELTDYDEKQVKDVFARMNKYVVKLSQQELRHAQFSGKFKQFVASIAKLPFWKRHEIFSRKQIRRKRLEEFAAELVVLLNEGPQDKKEVLNIYYQKYARSFPESIAVRKKLMSIFQWITRTLPNLKDMRFSNAIDFYSLVGALVSDDISLRRLNVTKTRAALVQFDNLLKAQPPSQEVAAYLAASSSQTDNIQPRLTRVETIRKILLSAGNG